MKVKNAVNFIGDFEKTLSAEAKKLSLDGVVCGHIHHATIKTIDDMQYINIGDFVESCTAIAEHEDGRLEIIHWNVKMADRVSRERLERTPQLPAPTAVAA